MKKETKRSCKSILTKLKLPMHTNLNGNMIMKSSRYNLQCSILHLLVDVFPTSALTDTRTCSLMKSVSSVMYESSMFSYSSTSTSGTSSGYLGGRVNCSRHLAITPGKGHNHMLRHTELLQGLQITIKTTICIRMRLGAEKTTRLTCTAGIFLAIIRYGPMGPCH